MEKKLPSLIAGIDKLWPGEGSIKLMYQDEARFGLISDNRRCWCPKPFRPVCPSMVSQQYIYAYAAVSVVDGEMDSLILPHVNGDCMQIFIDEVASRHPHDRVLMILDGAGWHRGIKLPSNLRIHFLPPYSPELNPVEHIWDEIREKYFANRVFENLDALEDQLTNALNDMECDHHRVRSIVAWPWIINALLN